MKRSPGSNHPDIATRLAAPQHLWPWGGISTTDTGHNSRAGSRGGIFNDSKRQAINGFFSGSEAAMTMPDPQKAATGFPNRGGSVRSRRTSSASMPMIQVATDVPPTHCPDDPRPTGEHPVLRRRYRNHSTPTPHRTHRGRKAALGRGRVPSRYSPISINASI